MRSYLFRRDTILNFILIVICIYHVSNIIYKNINPDVPEILIYEKKLNEIDFPISFLICLNEFDNDTHKYRKVGFNNVQDLFLGRRMKYNSTLKRTVIEKYKKGWKGHKVNGLSLTLENVADGLSINWKKYVESIQVFTVDDETFDRHYQVIKGTKLTWSKFPIYPNCKAVDLAGLIHTPNKTSIRIEQIKFKIRGMDEYAFFLYPLDKKRALTKRMFVRNMLSYSGSIIGNQFKGFTKNMRIALRITQNKYPEEDKTNPCSEYPNEEFQSYRECDEKFVHRAMKTKYNLTPFWATDNMSEVTDERFINKQIISKVLFHLHCRLIKAGEINNLNRFLNSFFDGRVASPCFKPCLESKVIKFKKLFLLQILF